MNRFQSLTQILAKRTADDIHKSLDAAVVGELAERYNKDALLSGEAKDLGGYLYRWRQRAKQSATLMLAIAGLTLGAIPTVKSPVARLILLHCSLGCILLAKQQQKTVAETLPIVATIAKLQASYSGIQLAQIWAAKPGKVEASGSIKDAPSTLPEALKLFDWNQLRDCDRFPHFLICGGTGSGKTYTTERIVKFLGGDITVITTKALTEQWQGLKVIGKGRDFDAIALALAELLQEMQRRMQDLDANHAPKIVVLDEFPSITANIESATDIVTTLIREAREAKIRLFILSQGRQVKTLKLEGQSDLRENLTDILLGQFASDRAKELVGRKQAQPALIDWCRGQSRPILVADEPALLSQIN